MADNGYHGLARLIIVPTRAASGLLQPVPTTFVTPRDFDLSPYFEVIKFNLIEDLKFDYRKIIWADEVESPANPAGKGRSTALS